jgi:hypothetical protein
MSLLAVLPTLAAVAIFIGTFRTRPGAEVGRRLRRQRAAAHH